MTTGDIFPSHSPLADTGMISRGLMNTLCSPCMLRGLLALSRRLTGPRSSQTSYTGSSKLILAGLSAGVKEEQHQLSGGTYVHTYVRIQWHCSTSGSVLTRLTNKDTCVPIGNPYTYMDMFSHIRITHAYIHTCV